MKRVRIKEKPHKEDYWIRDQVGQEFKVKVREKAIDTWEVVSGIKRLFGINFEDAELVRETMKVRVIRKTKSNQGSWTNNHIGEVFEVKQRDNWVYDVVRDTKGINRSVTSTPEVTCKATPEQMDVILSLLKMKGLEYTGWQARSEEKVIWLGTQNKFTTLMEIRGTEIPFQEFLEMVVAMRGKPETGKVKLVGGHSVEVCKDGTLHFQTEDSNTFTMDIGCVKNIIKVYEELQ